jgi:hypothetical protein
MVTRWPYRNERRVSDSCHEVIDRSNACACGVKGSFPRVRYGEGVLVDHPPTVETEVVDLVDVPVVVDPLEITTLHPRCCDLGKRWQRSPETRECRNQAITAFGVTFWGRVGESKIMGYKQ